VLPSRFYRDRFRAALWSAVPLAPPSRGGVPRRQRREQGSRKTRRKQNFRTPRAALESVLAG
jgi:hypothetical protein